MKNIIRPSILGICIFTSLIASAQTEAIVEEKLAPNYLNTIEPLLAHTGDHSIYSNPDLFRRVAKVYARRDHLKPERRRLVEKLYREFILAGAHLDDAARERIKAIKADLATISPEWRKTLKLRHEWATMVGYGNAAEMFVEATDLKTPGKVRAFLEEIRDRLFAVSKNKPCPKPQKPFPDEAKQFFRDCMETLRGNPDCAELTTAILEGLENERPGLFDRNHEDVARAIVDLTLHEATNTDTLCDMQIGFDPRYEAKYFTRLFARVMAEDILGEFRKKPSCYDEDLAFKFRRNFVEYALTHSLLESFKNFTRREPKLAPYLKTLGIDETKAVHEGDEPGDNNFGFYNYQKINDLSTLAAPPADALFRDPKAPIEARIHDVLKYMTPLEKMQILHQTSAASAGDIPRLGLPNFRMYDGPNGVRCDKPITYFPTCISYAAAFDRELAYAIGRAMGAETRAVVDEDTGEIARCLLGPGCNIARSPTGARNYEYFGEDPLLSGEMAAAFCSGLQSVKVAPALKHYVLNDQEWCRTCIDVSCGERALHEIYERPFEIACRKADVWTIMNSYNLINGVWASHAGTVNDDLRETGWTGAFMPDWGGTHGFTPAINGGTSFQTACRKDPVRDQELLKDLESGKLRKDRFNEALRETLRFFFRVGAFDADSPEEQALQAECKQLYRSEQHRRLAYRAAAESMVLLKNDDAFLPLDRAEIKKVCVLGPNADFHHTMFAGKSLRQCGGSGAILAGREPTPLETARELFGEENVSTKLSDARTADVVFYFGGFNHYTDREVLGGPQTPADRADISLDHQQLVELQQLSAYSKRIIVALTTGAPVKCQPWIKNAKAAFITWYAGEEGPTAFFDAVFGKVNPSGKLPYTFGYKLSDWYCHQLGEEVFPGTRIPQTTEGAQAKEKYADGIFVGYRGFDKLGIKPEFPFGFGLSYTDFEISDPVVGRNSISVKVANIGEVKGRAVIQLYISKLAGEGEQLPEMPVKELATFESVTLEPGEIRTIELKYGFHELKYYDERERRWRLPGACSFFVGQHSADRAVEGTIEIPSAFERELEEVEHLDSAADRRWQNAKTPEEITALQSEVRQAAQKAIGDFPKRTPLETRKIGEEKFDGYRVEKLIFASQPNYHVPCHLYLPDAPDFKPPYPAILMPCGHTVEGKSEPIHARAAVVAAKAGFAALLCDPIDQGERRQREGAKASGVHGHRAAGLRAHLLGENLAMYRVWDGIRAIDMLLERDDIDPMKIGCAGFSGGGTLTAYMNVFDARISAISPSAFITSISEIAKGPGPQDAEQVIFGQLSFALNHLGLMLTRAPKPILVGFSYEDFFPYPGSEATFDKATTWYRERGFEGKLDRLECHGRHGWYESEKAGLVLWMRRWLCGDESALPFDREALNRLNIKDAERIDNGLGLKTDPRALCAGGRVTKLPGEKTIYQLLAEKATALAANRQPLTRERVREIAGIDENRADRELSTVDCLFSETANGAITMTVTDAITYERNVKKFWYKLNGPSEELAAMMMWRGKNLVSRRAEDILAAAKRHYERGKCKPLLKASGETVIAAAHAYYLHPEYFSGIEIANPPPTWKQALDDERIELNATDVVFGAYRYYDWTELIED